MTQVSRQRFKDAITGSGGVVSDIARKLGISRQACYKRLQRPDLAELLHQEREATLDRAQTALMRLIDEGDGPSIRFILSTLGKHRGFTTRSELAADVNGTGSVTIFLPSNGRDVEGNESQIPKITNEGT